MVKKCMMLTISNIIKSLIKFLTLFIDKDKEEIKVAIENEPAKDISQYTEMMPYEIPSIYMSRDKRVMLPKRMALATPDTVEAIFALDEAVKNKQGVLYFSDGFRSTEAQERAHLDWKSGAKKAYSPPPGSSWHEAARAIDYDVEVMCQTISGGFPVFYDIASSIGWYFIIPTVDSNLSEAWHLEYRGDRFQDLKNSIGYKKAVQAAIRDIGFHPDDNETDDDIEMVQEMLITLGYNAGPIDGIIGKKTSAAIIAFKRHNKFMGSLELRARLYKNIELLRL